MMSSAWPWLTSLTPAHASATTWTSAPASAAASAEDSTQQSVDTPASTSRPPSPTRSASSGFQRLPPVSCEVVDELVDPRVRWLQRERPQVVVALPRARGNRRGDEPGEGDPGPERLDQLADRADDLAEPRGQPGAAGLGEHPLHVDDRQPPRRRPTAPRRLAHALLPARLRGALGRRLPSSLVPRSSVQATPRPSGSLMLGPWPWGAPAPGPTPGPAPPHGRTPRSRPSRWPGPPARPGWRKPRRRSSRRARTAAAGNPAR